MCNRADSFARAVASIVLIAAISVASAHEAAPIKPVVSPREAAPGKQAAHATKVPALLAVRGPLDAPPKGVAELKFRDVFKLPAGAKGLEPTDTLRKLDGKRVRIIGYMVQWETPIASGFLLSPLPVAAGDEDESLADDIPPSALFVSLPKGSDAVVPNLPGLIKVSGTLRVGAHEVAGANRVVPARIELDGDLERALLRLAKTPTKHPTKPR
jgi:hypothetical protein